MSLRGHGGRCYRPHCPARKSSNKTAAENMSSLLMAWITFTKIGFIGISSVNPRKKSYHTAKTINLKSEIESRYEFRPLF